LRPGLKLRNLLFALRLSKKPLKLRLKVRAKKVTGKTTVTTRVLRQRPRSR